MVSAQLAKPALCLLACICGTSASLLTRRTQTPGCSNSDGIAGYNFSHRGLWIPGYQLNGEGFSKQSCSEKCSQQEGCKAFSGAFEVGGNGACYTYTATGKNVLAGTDRAYRKCDKSLVPATDSTETVKFLTSLHLVDRKAMTEADLVTMAEGMEKQLDNVTATMGIADLKMRRLKSMVAGAAATLVGATRLASVTALTATGNSGNLKAIARARENINRSFEFLNSTNVSVDKVLLKVKGRAPKPGMQTGPSLNDLAPNVTDLEDKMNKLNDPATLKEIDSMVASYKNFTGTIEGEVNVVLRGHLRGLVDTQREALKNYTTAFNPEKKDPCCTPGCK